MNEKPFIHRCDIRHAGGSRIRILACRENCRERLADFDICVLYHDGHGPAQQIARGPLVDFPRALCVDALFATVLQALPTPAEPRDEHGNVVALPDLTPERCRAKADEYVRLAMECNATAQLLEAETIERAGPGIVVPARRRTRGGR